jgi:hypothetical protein
MLLDIDRLDELFPPEDSIPAPYLPFFDFEIFPELEFDILLLFYSDAVGVSSTSSASSSDEDSSLS